MILRPGAIALLLLIVVDLAMIAIALRLYPAFFSQPDGVFVVLEAVSVLLFYAGAVVWFGRTTGQDWKTILEWATPFGLLGGTLEALNIAIESGAPVAIHTPTVPIAFMCIVFASWGVAGFRAARSLNSIRAGVLTAVSSAAICMLIAVAAGFAIEFFAARPEPAIVLTWGEFKRSGWTDPRAFGLANTLDSAFTHLLIAPLVALILGGGASLLTQFRSSKETSTKPLRSSRSQASSMIEPDGSDRGGK